MRTSEVLNKAADLIEQHGWINVANAHDSNPWGGGGKPMCIEGGILAALGIEVTGGSITSDEDRELTNCSAYKAVQEYLGVDRLYRYNDTKGRTAEEVVSTLRVVARLEADKENNENEEQA